MSEEEVSRRPSNHYYPPLLFLDNVTIVPFSPLSFCMNRQLLGSGTYCLGDPEVIKGCFLYDDGTPEIHGFPTTTTPTMLDGCACIANIVDAREGKVVYSVEARDLKLSWEEGAAHGNLDPRGLSWISLNHEEKGPVLEQNLWVGYLPKEDNRFRVAVQMVYGPAGQDSVVCDDLGSVGEVWLTCAACALSNERVVEVR